MAGEEQLSPYTKNEISANRYMTFVLLFAAALLFIVWLGYIPNVFNVAEDTYIMTITILPVVVVLLCTPLLFLRSRHLSNPYYKYYVLLLFVLAISVLNAIMPKHGILGWAVCVALTGHYYNPMTCRIVFVTVLVMMVISLFFGIFIGEYDSNLLSGQLDTQTQTIHNFLLTDTYPDSPSGRYRYLSDLMAAGENQYAVIFTSYLGGRMLFVTMTFVVIVFLNKRTKVLLTNEVVASNENQKNRTELEVAKKIQLETLPEATVSSDNIEIIAELKAAKEVGGDLYDYLDIDDDHFAFLVGDVSGKGVPAAMFMMKTITAFRDFAKEGKSPSRILKEINNSILKGNTASMFVTCFLAILDKRNGKIVYANAGHNPPMIGSNGRFSYLECNPGFLLGCFKDTFIKDERTVLEPGDSIILYTDGVTEARNSEGEFFGEERFIQTVNGREYLGVADMHHSIESAITGFVGDAPQSDDITILTVKYRGITYSAEENDFDAKLENIPEMLGFIETFVQNKGIPDDFRKKLVIVGDELLSNIIKYGYRGNGGEIHVRLQFDDRKKEFAMTFIDGAEEFNPLKVEDKPIGEDGEVQKVGGLGLLIVTTIMDDCSYDRKKGKNILVLRKRF